MRRPSSALHGLPRFGNDGAVTDGDQFADLLWANAAYAHNFSPGGLEGRARRVSLSLLRFSTDGVRPTESSW
jgi:hypothetical protein